MLTRWTDAGVLETSSAERIRQWERSQPAAGVSNRLAAIAFGFGGLLLIAGAFLFVSAHWDTMPVAARFAVVLALVAALHLGAAWSVTRSPRLSTTLHATGTAALGAGIYLSGQIFNMAEHWPAALLLWAIGAVLTLALLKDWPHVLWVAVLVPSWLIGEWGDDFGRSSNFWHNAVPVVGTALLSCAYLSAQSFDENAQWRRALSRLGAVCFIPASIMLGLVTQSFSGGPLAKDAPVDAGDLLAAIVAIGLPFAVTFALRGKRAFYLLAALIWCLATIQFHWGREPQNLGLYALYALGAIGLATWGIRDQQRMIVNLGVFSFALTTLAFYFSDVMDRLGRSFSLIAGGLLFLIGGWLLERVRRRLIAGIAEVPQ